MDRMGLMNEAKEFNEMKWIEWMIWRKKKNENELK